MSERVDYRHRVDRLASWLASERLSAALFVDVEGRRDLNIRYLTGQPGDSLLMVLVDGKTVLIPWDFNLARSVARADVMIPYTDFNRSLTSAVEAIVAREKLAGPIEVSASTPYPVFERLRNAAGRSDIVCRSDGLDEIMSDQRMRKDGQELRLLERAAEITNELLDLLASYLSGARGSELSEVDVALFLERAARERGAEGMAFDSLVAGPTRSFGIHAFPTYTSSPFATEGMSILDFGVLVEGYPSDVTVTVLAGELTAKQREMVALVEQAYDLALSMAKPGAETREIAAAVDRLFEREGYAMPHSLGHGLGLEVHERPALRNKPEVKTRLEAGMIFTIEPGLYDPEAGGVRLENDLLITSETVRVLTTSRILHLP